MSSVLLSPFEGHNLPDRGVILLQSPDGSIDDNSENVKRVASLFLRPSENNEAAIDLDGARGFNELDTGRHTFSPIDSTKNGSVIRTFCAFHKSEQLRLIPYRGETGREWTEKVAA